MKAKYILPALAALVVTASCDDEKMEWGLPEGHTAITSAEIPLSVKEQLANYEALRVYAEKYMSEDFQLGLGAGLDFYISSGNYRSLVNENFQMVTPGNAMKHDAIVSNSGALNFSTVDAYLDAVTESGGDLKLYGHNFIWHTQQRQAYLKSLIAPVLTVITEGDDTNDIINMLTGDDSDFEGGTTGAWASWGNSSSKDVTSPGYDGSTYAMHLTNPSDANFWSAQCAYTFSDYLDPSKEYKIRFYAKSSSGAGQLQFQYQNGETYGSQGAYTTFEVGNNWTLCEAQFTPAYEDVNRILINFGAVGAEYTIDNIEFGLYQEVQEPDPMINVLSGDDSDFEGGTTGAWASWGNSSSKDVADEGYESDHCMHLNNPTDANAWSAQCAYTFTDPMKLDETYVIQFYAKSSTASGQLQFQYQNGETYGSQGGYNTFEVGTDWVLCQYEFTQAYEDANRILLNFGAVGGDYYIDNIKFGVKNAEEETESDPMMNVLADDNSTFEGGTKGAWGSWGNSSESGVVEPGHDSNYCMYLLNPTDAEFWNAQCAYDFSDYLVNGETYIIQFYAKSESAAGQLQFQYQNGSTYGSQGAYNTFDVGTDWTLCQHEFTVEFDDVNRILLNFGKVGTTYYIDDVKFGVKVPTQAPARMGQTPKHAKSGTRVVYVSKTAEEKRAALLGAMDTWIKGVADHLKEKGITPYGYDVVNEAISDGYKVPRGILTNGHLEFNGTDQEPEENEETGMTLNWEDGHFYWGYYVGEDYAAQAFQMARKYLPAETKLFINDYNLETSEAKRDAFIAFVKRIDELAGSAVVDGVGTQMHLTLDISSDDSFDQQIEEFMGRVDASLKALVATGKLVRITELDISLGTATPSATQLEAQYEAYRRIFESYKSIVPAAQQSGITIWTLSDNAAEHEYWLPDESPNLYDANYLRKWAYKGVCDGMAGYDIGATDFSGDDWKAYYENGNTSDF